jgi:hypothetical protein
MQSTAKVDVTDSKTPIDGNIESVPEIKKQNILPVPVVARPLTVRRSDLRKAPFRVSTVRSVVHVQRSSTPNIKSQHVLLRRSGNNRIV